MAPPAREPSFSTAASRRMLTREQRVGEPAVDRVVEARRERHRAQAEDRVDELALEEVGRVAVASWRRTPRPTRTPSRSRTPPAPAPRRPGRDRRRPRWAGWGRRAGRRPRQSSQPGADRGPDLERARPAPGCAAARRRRRRALSAAAPGLASAADRAPHRRLHDARSGRRRARPRPGTPPPGGRSPGTCRSWNRPATAPPRRRAGPARARRRPRRPASRARSTGQHAGARRPAILSAASPMSTAARPTRPSTAASGA